MKKACWDKEKRQFRAKRTLIGRLDKETGEIVPTDGRVRNARKREVDPGCKTLYEGLLVRYGELEAELRALRAASGTSSWKSSRCVD